MDENLIDQSEKDYVFINLPNTSLEVPKNATKSTIPTHENGARKLNPESISLLLSVRNRMGGMMKAYCLFVVVLNVVFFSLVIHLVWFHQSPSLRHPHRNHQMHALSNKTTSPTIITNQQTTTAHTTTTRPKDYLSYQQRETADAKSSHHIQTNISSTSSDHLLTKPLQKTDPRPIGNVIGPMFRNDDEASSFYESVHLHQMPKSNRTTPSQSQTNKIVVAANSLVKRQVNRTHFLRHQPIGRPRTLTIPDTTTTTHHDPSNTNTLAQSSSHDQSNTPVKSSHDAVVYPPNVDDVTTDRLTYMALVHQLQCAMERGLLSSHPRHLMRRERERRALTQHNTSSTTPPNNKYSNDDVLCFIFILIFMCIMFGPIAVLCIVVHRCIMTRWKVLPLPSQLSGGLTQEESVRADSTNS